MSQSRWVCITGLFLTGSAVLLSYAQILSQSDSLSVVLLGIAFIFIGWTTESFTHPVPAFEWLVTGTTEKSLDDLSAQEVHSYLQWLHLKRTQKTPTQFFFPQLRKYDSEELKSQMKACLTELDDRGTPLPNRERYERQL